MTCVPSFGWGRATSGGVRGLRLHCILLRFSYNPRRSTHGLVSAHQRVQYTPTDTHTDTRTRTERVYSAAVKSYLPFSVCSFGAVLYTETSELLGELQKSQRTAIICSVCVCVCVRNIGERGVGRVDTIPTQSQREIPPKVFVAGWWEDGGDFRKLRAGARANGFSPRR